MSSPIINTRSNNPCNNTRNNYDFLRIIHTIQKKTQKTVNDYSNKSIYDFRLVVVDTYPKLIDKEKEMIETPFGAYYKDQSIYMI